MRQPHVVMEQELGRWKHYRVAGNGHVGEESETRYTTRRSCRRAALRDFPGLPIIVR